MAEENKTTTELENSEAEKTASAKLPPNVVKVKERWWVKYLTTFGVFAVFTLLVAWLMGAFSEVSPSLLAERNITELQYRMQQWSDAFFVPGALGLGFGLLIIASNGGTFDMLAYGMRAFFGLFKKDVIDRKYGSFYEYRKARQQKKRSFWYLVIIGGAFTLIGGLFTLLYYTV